MNNYIYDFRGTLSKDKIKKSLQVNGFVLIKNVIPIKDLLQSKKIIQQFLNKKGIYISLGKSQPNAAGVIEDLSFIFGHKNIIEIFKMIFFGDKFVYTQHADVHKNLISGWHKDSGESQGEYFNGDCFGDKDCEVYKVGIYLQNTNQTIDGLTVKIKSHLTNKNLGIIKKIDTNLGDIIIFDVRVSHMGKKENFIEKTIRIFERYYRNIFRISFHKKTFLNFLSEFYHNIRNQSDRFSIFFTFGKDNIQTKEFSLRNIQRQEKQLGYKNIKISNVLKNIFLKNNINISDD